MEVITAWAIVLMCAGGYTYVKPLSLKSVSSLSSPARAMGALLAVQSINFFPADLRADRGMRNAVRGMRNAGCGIRFFFESHVNGLVQSYVLLQA